MNCYKVYMHTSPSGKRYIGITSQEVKTRWQYGNGYKHSAHFYSAIKKYGWNNINHEILFDGLTKEEAEQKEIELITKYKSNDTRYGYNIADGGFSHKQTEETKRKIKIAKSNISDETRRKLSDALKGTKRSDELKKKWSEQRKGKGTTKVKCVETGVVYNSIKEAAAEFGLHPSNISRCTRKVKNYLTVGGYHWETGE